jgi:threonine synthase
MLSAMNGHASYLRYLRCSECGERYPSDFAGSKRCDDGGVLLARYDLDAASREISRDKIAEGPGTLWRYAPLLPVADPSLALSLGEGWTPLLRTAQLGKKVGCPQLYIKDEGRNPSGSFKDRGASVAVSRYRELGIQTVVLNSSGNAGAAWSLYAAKAGIECISIVPPDIPAASLKQCVLAGAQTYVFRDWHRAGKLVADLAAQNDWFNAGTLKEPYRVEGKKTIGYELAEQFGWTLPDVIFYPLGGGTGAIAIWKAFQELRDLGWIHGRLPRLFVTQYQGCAPVVKAFEDGTDVCVPWGSIDILPGGLKSPNPPGGKQVLALIRETGGGAISVTTREALDAVADAASTEGIFAGPEGGTTLAGLRKALAQGAVSPDERVVLINTGSGLKSVPSLEAASPREIKFAEDLTTAEIASR